MVGWLEKNIHYALNKPSSNTAVGTSWQSGFGSKNSKVHFFFLPQTSFPICQPKLQWMNVRFVMTVTGNSVYGSVSGGYRCHCSRAGVATLKVNWTIANTQCNLWCKTMFINPQNYHLDYSCFIKWNSVFFSLLLHLGVIYLWRCISGRPNHKAYHTVYRPI